MMKPCMCGCARLVSPVAMIEGWRESCAIAILLDIRKLQNLEPNKLTILASMAHDAGAEKLASAIVGAVPFEPPYRELMQ